MLCVTRLQVFSVKDLYPGQPLTVTLLDHTPSGAVVSISPSLTAFVPRSHLTDGAPPPPGDKLPSRLRTGKALPARVLEVDAARKRVSVTLKKGLIGSRLPPLADAKAAAPGTKAHGVVTGAAPYGVFVSFFGGVSGLLPAASLELLPGQAPGDAYAVGQLLRCQVRGAGGRAELSCGRQGGRVRA